MRQIKLCGFVIWIISAGLLAAADSGQSEEGLAAPRQFLEPPLAGATDSFATDSQQVPEAVDVPRSDLVPPSADTPATFREARSTQDVEAPLTSLVPPLKEAPRVFREDSDSDSHAEDALIDEHEHGDHAAAHHQHNATVQDNEVPHNATLHDEINALLGHDEERVLAGGEVKIRKKRTFCKRCFPTVSYGYGGGGGCCGSCGQCGGGYRRPARARVVVVQAVPVYGGGCGGRCGGGYGGGYGGYGGGGGCGVCGRK